jgi:hypothetical protein
MLLNRVINTSARPKPCWELSLLSPMFLKGKTAIDFIPWPAGSD